MSTDYFYKEIICKTKHIIFFIISLIALASCQKNVKQSYTPNQQDYIGKWKYEVWINDTTEENKYFGLELRSAGNDSIEGLFCSVWLNGERLDGSNADEEATTNVWGKFINDSLYVNVQGGRWEDASAKAVMYLINDSSLLWKTTSVEGEIFIPDSVILKRDCDSIKNAKVDSVTEPTDTSNVQANDTSAVRLKGKLSEYSVNGLENGLYEYEKPLGDISLIKSGKVISKIDLPGYEPNCNFSFFDVQTTDNGFSFNILYGHTHLYYEQTFVFEYINGDFYLVKTLDRTPIQTEDGFDFKEKENKLKEPIPFSKVNIEKMMLI